MNVAYPGKVEDIAQQGAEVGLGGFRADAKALDGASLGPAQDAIAGNDDRARIGAAAVDAKHD
jgi:hypothetical protein